jgi:hypothetical protein
MRLSVTVRAQARSNPYDVDVTEYARFGEGTGLWSLDVCGNDPGRFPSWQRNVLLERSILLPGCFFGMVESLHTSRFLLLPCPLRLRRKAGRKQCTNRNRPVVCVASYFPRRRPCASTTFRFDAFKRRGRILIDQKMRCDAPRPVTVLRSHHRHRQHETTPAGVYHARGCALAPESGDIVTFGLVCHNDRAAETKCAGGIL